MNKMIYASVHHQNTQKVIDYLLSHLSPQFEAIDILKNNDPDLAGAEYVIFASGIYFNSLHKTLLDYIRSTDLTGKKVILLYTCGLKYRDYTKEARKILAGNGADDLGSCCCRGYDTFGPFAQIGGIAKGHPNDKDFQKVFRSIEALMKEK